MKKTVGILTLHWSNNFGAQYQAWALYKFVESLGYDVKFLDYEMEAVPRSKYFRNPIAFIKKIVSKKELFINSVLELIGGRQALKDEQAYAKIFSDFRGEFLPLTQKFSKYDDLVMNKLDLDYLIVGSDQVWAADFFFSSPAYLLGFASGKTKRIAYAPSFGKSALEGYLKDTFKEYIDKFDSVSVRENSGVEIVSELTDQTVSKVVDPTLLFSDYGELLDDTLVPEAPYILVYRLKQEQELSKWFDESIKALSECHSLPVYSVSTNMEISDGSNVLTPTPAQLLSLFKNSKLVLTNSFHGTVFSLQFDKLFLSFSRDAFEDKQNLRLTELLGNLDLKDRYCSPFESFEKVRGKSFSAIEWRVVREKILVEREASINFLKSALLVK